MKTCIRCKTEHPLSNYYKDSSKKDGLTPYCTPCRKEKSRLQNLKNPQLARDRARKKRVENGLRLDLQRRKMTEKEYNQKLIEQDYKCAICRKEETAAYKGTVRRLSVDHDHLCCYKKKDTCGKCTRGLLCNRCNATLGYFKDDVDILLSAIDYLTEWRDNFDRAKQDNS